MKKINYQELSDNDTLETLEVGDMIENKPPRVKFAAAIDRGFVEGLVDLVIITTIVGNEKEKVFLAKEEMDAIIKAIEWARK